MSICLDDGGYGGKEKSDKEKVLGYCGETTGLNNDTRKKKPDRDTLGDHFYLPKGVCRNWFSQFPAKKDTQRDTKNLNSDKAENYLNYEILKAYEYQYRRDQELISDWVKDRAKLRLLISGASQGSINKVGGSSNQKYYHRRLEIPEYEQVVKEWSQKKTKIREMIRPYPFGYEYKNGFVQPGIDCFLNVY